MAPSAEPSPIVDAKRQNRPPELGLTNFCRAMSFIPLTQPGILEQRQKEIDAQTMA
jgi:hypothetical protein